MDCFLQIFAHGKLSFTFLFKKTHSKLSCLITKRDNNQIIARQQSNKTKNMKYDGNFIKMTLINKNRIEIGK